MLSIRHLAKSYVPGKPVLNDINLDIAARGITAIIGPSGTGKSTLIRCINRLVEPSAGEIEFEGEYLVGLSRRALRRVRRRIGMVFQEYNLVERLSVMENVLSGRLGYVSPWRAWRRKFPPEDIARAFELLGVVGLAGFAGSRADSLSGGQRQRVGIARAVMQQPAVLLADEPTSSLDPKTSVEIMQLLADIARARGIRHLCLRAARRVGGTDCERPLQRGAFFRPDVSSELRALGSPGQGPEGKPRDRRARLGARHRAVATDRLRCRAQPDACVGELAGATGHRCRPLVSSGDRGYPVRQGGRLRRARGDSGADRRLDRFHRQALRGGDRGDF